MLGTKEEQLTAQRKTACCNCSICWKRTDGVERLGHLGQFLLLLDRQDA